MMQYVDSFNYAEAYLGGGIVPYPLFWVANKAWLA